MHRDLVKGIPLAPAEHGAVALQMGWAWGIRAKRRPHAQPQSGDTHTPGSVLPVTVDLQLMDAQTLERASSV